MKSKTKMSPKSSALMQAWIDYCGTNRLIAYGELSTERMKAMSDDEIENYISKRAKQMYEADVAKIRRQYESNDCIS